MILTMMDGRKVFIAAGHVVAIVEVKPTSGDVAGAETSKVYTTVPDVVISVIEPFADLVGVVTVPPPNEPTLKSTKS